MGEDQLASSSLASAWVCQLHVCMDLLAFFVLCMYNLYACRPPDVVPVMHSLLHFVAVKVQRI